MPSNAADLTSLFMRERTVFMRLAQRLLGNRTTAEDVTQGVWFRLQRVEDDPPIVDKRAYLYRLLINLAADRRRADARHDALFCAEDVPETAASPTPSAERILLDREKLRRLMEAVDELSPRCREVFLLRKMEELPVSEICERLGISRSMVARHLDNALRHCFARVQEPRE